MADVLDYSAGWPPPAAIKAAGYVGVVRYVGTPGRAKNLTRTEAQAMTSAGIPIALVYETTAGWALGGAAVGTAAARAALADAAACEVQVRCVYFAVDVDVTDAQQMQAVQRTLGGAADVLGRDRTGVYGEADVIDACVPAHAAYGWQTRAWSGGRVSPRAHLLQQVGYVYPGGVQCDRSTVLQDDWGQCPKEDITMADATSLEAQITALARKLDDVFRLETVGDAPDSQRNPDGTPVDRGGHPNNIERIRSELAAMKAAVGGQLTALASAVSALSGLVAAGTNDLTPEDVKSAVREAIDEGLVHVAVTVAGQTQRPDEPPAA